MSKLQLPGALSPTDTSAYASVAPSAVPSICASKLPLATQLLEFPVDGRMGLALSAVQAPTANATRTTVNGKDGQRISPKYRLAQNLCPSIGAAGLAHAFRERHDLVRQDLQT